MSEEASSLSKTPILLVVDDDPEVTAQISKELSRYRLSIETFNDAKTFLKRFKEVKPDIAIIDYNIDVEKSGCAATRAIRTVLGPKVPIVIMSRQKDMDMETESKKCGANEFLQKPFEHDTLTAILAEFITLEEDPSAKLNPHVKWTFEQIVPVMADIKHYVQEFDEQESRVQFYQGLMAEYSETFIKMVQSMRGKSDEVDLATSIRFYGVDRTRDLIVGRKLFETIYETPFRWDETTSRPVEDPKELLNFAVNTLEHFGDDSPNQTYAFRSGIIFDIFSHVLQKSDHPKKAAVKKLLEELHEKALQFSDHALDFAKDFENLELVKHVVSAAMLQEIGTVALAMQDPDYLDWLSFFESKSIPPVLRYVAEEKKYGVSSNQLSGLVCQMAPGLREAYFTVLYCEFPFFISSTQKKNRTYFNLTQLFNNAAIQIRSSE